MKPWLATSIFAGMLFFPVQSLAQQPDLHIAMQLSKTSVVLGEPVWVDVAVTNVTQKPLRVQIDDNCFARQLEIQVPQAQPGNGEHRLCGGAAVSCMTPGPQRIGAGQTAMRRYVMTGDFRITQPGTYSVVIKEVVSFSLDAGDRNVSHLPRDAFNQQAEQTIILDVQPPDSHRLLDIERTLAAEAAKPFAHEVPIQGPHGIETQRTSLQPERDREQAYSDAKAALADGLSEYPAAGMEPAFNDWMLSGDGQLQWYGLHALYKLNTAQSRRLIAQAADPTRAEYVRWRTNSKLVIAKPADESVELQQYETWRAGAVRALDDMGDPSYLPLLERLSRDPGLDVRGNALSGLGLLGGASELPMLVRLARAAGDVQDREDAIYAFVYTDSLEAVPALISLFGLPDANQTIDDALTVLTGYDLPPSDRLTATQYRTMWQAWWQANKGRARVQGPFDCHGGPSFAWL